MRVASRSHNSSAARGASDSRTGGASTGAKPAARASALSQQRKFRAVPRVALRNARSGGPRNALRQQRAACTAMLDLFIHAWDDLDDS
jgi:hypothetical protein